MRNPLADKVIERNPNKEVYVCATHPVFSGPALERLEKAPIKEVIVTNKENSKTYVMYL